MVPGEANLPDDLSLHGLRKAPGARRAEAGATQEEIAAALGHRGTRTAEICIKGAEKRRLADAGFAGLAGTNQEESVPPCGVRSVPPGKNV
jgi:LDH2 family malate/lactate/ureidoglycolate dehydrogenase